MNKMSDIQRAGEAAAAPCRLIFAEFNELCPWLIDRWMADGRLPNFRRMHDRSAVFETRADVADPVHLEPWIQWYSLHTGLSFDQHRVFHLTEGAKAGHDDLWRVAHRGGRTVGSFASMNTRPFDFAGGFYVADPWSEDGNAAPAELDIYSRFVGSNVREYSNPNRRLTLGDKARFLAFMLRRGLSAGTVARIVAQLTAERLKDRRLSWRRAALLDRLQFDVFRHYQRTRRPDFSTFFINSTAHFQHSYWRHFQPEAFTVKPPAADLALYGDAILFGYQAMDALLGAFMALAEETGAMLVFMTALSQQPYLDAEESGGRHFYRLLDVEGLFRRLDLPFANIDPTMTHQYLATFARDADLERARAALGGFRMADGRVLFDFNARTEGGLYFSCDLRSEVAPDARIVAGSGETLRFGDLLYRIDATKSGRHHPAGALWFATGRHRRFADPVSILDIFPTALDLMGVDRSGAEGRTGTSLVGLLR
ncbi:hypothetical protein RCO27_10670 [Sphingosinicella sp. LHD-64]|uniref:hypothetical protein n=1 Tax=Sphingosinicella sp. LHD-64 TaxID=3072139 RepID=UPI00280C87DD|nr:hypothetical protein [Sphingosinicella sp. LHD-64]MDQ8756691.1 hypothetical protein [Sphingosinicella sp. LHD-64]